MRRAIGMNQLTALELASNNQLNHESLVDVLERLDWGQRNAVAARTIASLTRRGYVSKFRGSYVITPAGIEAMNATHVCMQRRGI